MCQRKVTKQEVAEQTKKRRLEAAEKRKKELAAKKKGKRKARKGKRRKVPPKARVFFFGMRFGFHTITFLDFLFI